MKSKQLKTSLLLIAVIAIWGYLIYKVVISLNPEEPTGVFQNAPSDFRRNIAQQPQEEFEVYIPTRDPFLNIVINKPKPKPTTTKRTPKKPGINLDSLWSGIQYKGRIGKKESSDYLYLINLKNNEVLLKPNQDYKGFKLIKANKDQISLKHKSYQKSFSVLTP